MAIFWAMDLVPMLAWESVMPQSVSGTTLAGQGPGFPAVGWTMRVRLKLLQPESQARLSTKQCLQLAC